MKKISIVISVYNEEENVEKLYEELIFNEIQNYSYEYIFVNDGSTDKSSNIISNLCKENKNVIHIEFTRNYGHEIAMTAGMDCSSGDAVIFMDADLQHPPYIIKEMINIWNKTAKKIVLTVRLDNEEKNILYKFLSKFYYKMINYLSDFEFEKNTPDFRLIDRNYINIIKNFKENSRLFRGILYLIGINDEVAYIEFIAPHRYSGKTKYNYSKLFNLAIDGIISFSIKPLRIALIFSFLIFIFSIIYGLFILFAKLLNFLVIEGMASQLLITIILGSANLFVLSIIGEYIGRIHLESKNRPLYTIRKIENFHE